MTTSKKKRRCCIRVPGKRGYRACRVRRGLYKATLPKRWRVRGHSILCHVHVRGISRPWRIERLTNRRRQGRR
jgi:hypothetical protein